MAFYLFGKKIPSWIRWLLLLWLLGFPLPSAAAELLSIGFEGVTGEMRDNLAALLVAPPNLLQDGVVDERWLQRFVDRVPQTAARALKPFGYYEPEIETELEALDPARYRLTVRIDPGPAIRVTERRIDLRGPGADYHRVTALPEAFPLRPGDVLHQGVYEEGKTALLRSVRDLGYLDADYTVQAIRLDVARAAAEIELVVETGPRYRFGDASFSGAEQYPDSFLRRYLAFESGDIFSYARLGETQLNLLDADRFREIQLLADRAAAEEDRIPVEVVLVPAPTMRLRPGIGYGTDTGARVSLRFDHLNLLHRGHQLGLQLNASELRQSALAVYTMPAARRLQSANILRAGYEREELDTFDREKLTLEAERLRDFGRGRKGSLYVQLFQETYSVGQEKNTARMVIPGVRFFRRRYRELVRPRKGHQYALEVRGGHQLLGSDTGLLQILASANVLQPLPGRFSLFSRFEGGFTTQNQPFRQIPASLRFFAGGDQSVRGYPYQSLGPEDDQGDVIGGKHLVVGSLELEQALGERWGLALFYDVGNAFNDFDRMDLKQGAGLGVRRYTPVGPIRLDLARQIGEPRSSYRIHLGIGFGW